MLSMYTEIKQYYDIIISMHVASAGQDRMLLTVIESAQANTNKKSSKEPYTEPNRARNALALIGSHCMVN